MRFNYVVRFLIARLNSFVNAVCYALALSRHRCCSDIVNSAMQKKLALHEENADVELKELIRFKVCTSDVDPLAKVLLWWLKARKSERLVLVLV